MRNYIVSQLYHICVIILHLISARTFKRSVDIFLPNFTQSSLLILNHLKFECYITCNCESLDDSATHSLTDSPPLSHLCDKRFMYCKRGCRINATNLTHPLQTRLTHERSTVQRCNFHR